MTLSRSEYVEARKAADHSSARKAAHEKMIERKHELEQKWLKDPQLPAHEGWIPIYSEKHDRCVPYSTTNDNIMTSVSLSLYPQSTAPATPLSDVILRILVKI